MSLSQELGQDPAPGFPVNQTRWSVVLRASRPEDSGWREALSQLYVAYQYPLYAFARGRGLTAEDSQDAVQGFFVHLIAANLCAKADSDRGRFRTFLRVCFRNFLTNERRGTQTVVRGGTYHFVPLSVEDAETHFTGEPANMDTPDVLYDRRWALQLLSRVLSRLRQEHAAKQKEELFEKLKDFISDKQAAPHGMIAAELGISVGAVGVAIHRLRARYGQLLLEEVADTLGDAADVEEEIRHLIASLGK